MERRGYGVGLGWVEGEFSPVDLVFFYGGFLCVGIVVGGLKRQRRGFKLCDLMKDVREVCSFFF